MLGQQFFSVKKYSEYIHEHFIPVYARIEDEFGETIQDKYHINSNPSLLITKPDGSLYDILTSYREDPEKYLERVRKSVNGINTYASIKEQFDRSPNDLRKVYALADKHFQMWQPREGVELCQKIVDRLNEAKSMEVLFEGKNINLYEVARYGTGFGEWLNRRSPDGLEAFRSEFPTSMLSHQAYSELANIYLNLPISDKGESFYGDLKHKYPDDPSLLNMLVRYYTKSGKHLDEGEKYARKLVGLRPKSRGYRQNAADLFLKNDNADRALKIYGKAYIQDHMEVPNELNSYAWFWALRSSNLESALETIQKAFKLDPKDDNLLDTMSMVYWKMKEYKKAIETEERALRMNPDNQGYRERIEEIRKDMAKNGITQL